MNKLSKLLKRIKSLEEYLGVKFSPADDSDGYNEHVTDTYGLIKGLQERVRDLENKNNVECSPTLPRSR